MAENRNEGREFFEDRPAPQRPPEFGIRDSAAAPAEEGLVDAGPLPEDMPPDPALPTRRDWNYRPNSPSEMYVDADTDIRFAEDVLNRAENIPAILGAGLSIFGFWPGVPGLAVAIMALLFCVAGLYSASRGARRGALAFAGVVISLMWIVGHAAFPGGGRF